MTERARMIMSSRLCCPLWIGHARSSLPGMQNGRIFTGDSVLIDAVSLGADDLGGTTDDGRIREIEVYLNGKLSASLSDGNLTANSEYSFYRYIIPTSQPAGEYLLEVVAEDVGGLRSRESVSFVIRARGPEPNKP